jgi:hypothetical protein
VYAGSSGVGRIHLQNNDFFKILFSDGFAKIAS